MATNMALEARQVLSGGFETMGPILLMRSVARSALDEHARGASWYNDDTHFQQAVGEVMVAKGEVLAQYAGEARARQMPGYDEPVFD